MRATRPKRTIEGRSLLILRDLFGLHHHPAQGPKPSIQQAADALGVHRVHLSFVLNGHRSSKSLLAKVEAKFPHLIKLETEEGEANE